MGELYTRTRSLFLLLSALHYNTMLKGLGPMLTGLVYFPRNRHCWPENVGSCWLVLVVVYKLVQQLPTMLGPAVHYAVILIN